MLRIFSGVFLLFVDEPRMLQLDRKSKDHGTCARRNHHEPLESGAFFDFFSLCDTAPVFSPLFCRTLPWATVDKGADVPIVFAVRTSLVMTGTAPHWSRTVSMPPICELENTSCRVQRGEPRQELQGAFEHSARLAPPVNLPDRTRLEAIATSQ